MMGVPETLNLEAHQQNLLSVQSVCSCGANIPSRGIEPLDRHKCWTRYADEAAACSATNTLRANFPSMPPVAAGSKTPRFGSPAPTKNWCKVPRWSASTETDI